ncbi:uncharacterized protein ATC70_003660 [Mucor velutinosus]|uniref:Kelch repeat protein n=1 Tax=Mucor velutinosus TaxID=708070 RepID=A0AAN7D9D0_9FUNG|nr:hypothetical protein ATC70_003660 [Mucor velutinosus]
MKTVNLKKLLIILSAIALSAVSGQPSVARSDANCDFINRSIYCFGGVPAVGDNTLPDNTVMMIDLTFCNENTAQEIKDKWVTEAPRAERVDILPRSHAQGIALPDGHQFLLSGGFNNGSGPIADQTIVYNVFTQKWSKYANFVDGSFGNRQMYNTTLCMVAYYASTVDVPNVGIGFYGGFEQNINRSWTMGTGQNLTKAEFNGGSSRTIGYPKMTFLDLSDSFSPWRVPSQSRVPTVYSAHQSSIYDKESKNIYFFGGEYYNIDDPLHDQPTAIEHTFNYSLFYNVETHTWGNQTWGGAKPSSRKYHTTTLLSSKRDVLLYGGESKEGAVSDFCYVLNLDTKQWVQQAIEASLATKYIRTRHSYVMEEDSNTLFILFGKNNATIAVNDILMLNTTDPKNISLYETYHDPMTWDLGETSIDASSNTALIVGISVGATVAGIVLVGLIIYFWRKRRASTKSVNTQKTQWIQKAEASANHLPKDQMPASTQRAQWIQKAEAPANHLPKDQMPASSKPDTRYSYMVSRPSLQDDEATLIGFNDASAASNRQGAKVLKH